ncbi:MAG: copper resistance protein CopC [Nitriliruptoraceae bacterium]
MALAWLLVILAATPVFAHAALLTSTLGDGDRFVAAPREVTLTFSETVTLPRDAVKLYDQTASVRTGVAVAVAGSDVVVTLPALDDGTYVLTVRVLSKDGHVVHQPFRFVVGDAADSLDEVALDALLGQANRDPTRLAMVVLRATTYLAMLVALGFVALHRRMLDSAGLRRYAQRFAAGMAAVGALAALASALITLWWLYAPRGVTALVVAVGDTATRGFLLRAAALGLLGLLLRVPRLRFGVYVAAAFVVAAQVFDGHQLSFGVRPVMLAADTVHVLAASVWFGGAVLLWWVWRHDVTVVREAARRFSQLAFWAAVVTVVSGVAMAFQLLDSPGALFTTGYGNVLGGKIVAVVALGVLSFRVRGVLTREPFVSAALRRRLRADVGAFVVVLSLTAVMVTTSPQPDSGGALVTQRSTFGPYTLDIAIEPGVIGTNVLHAYVITAAGTLAATGDDLSLTATYVAPDGERIGPFPTELAWVSDGHFLAVTDVFAFAGRWELTFRAPVDRFTVVSETVIVTLG